MKVVSHLGGKRMSKRRLVSLDWAIKRLLRSKANFVVLEGFLSELLEEDIKIIAILEGESNQEHASDKQNRVDIKVQNQKGEIIIVEIQYNQEIDFFQRVLYSASKTVTEHIFKGEEYVKVPKVISINILYFNLGEGIDYIYKGSNSFIGLHHKDQLKLTAGQREIFVQETPEGIFPEYYLINVDKFDNVATTPFDEWIYFLKNETIEDDFTAKGLAEAKEILDVMKLSEEDRRQYEKHKDNVRSTKNTIFTAKVEARAEGREEGIEIGEDKKNREFVLRLFNKKYDTATISDLTGLGLKEVQAIIDSIAN
jgi:predicted transposase/invertase (TIGR01784 family)